VSLSGLFGGFPFRSFIKFPLGGGSDFPPQPVPSNARLVGEALAFHLLVSDLHALSVCDFAIVPAEGEFVQVYNPAAFAARVEHPAHLVFSA
jgi:hypothetical protein